MFPSIVAEFVNSLLHIWTYLTHPVTVKAAPNNKEEFGRYSLGMFQKSSKALHPHKQGKYIYAFLRMSSSRDIHS